MIKSITVTNYHKESVKITLTEAEPEHGLLIQSIDGLGPPKANIRMNDFSTMDGSVFNSARAEKRNIVIHMLFTPAPTIEDTRQRTYKYFPVKKEIDLLIETDNRILNAHGFVESNEPDIFSQQEGNTISVLCEDSYLYSATDGNLTSFSFIYSLFEFPFSNEYLNNYKYDDDGNAMIQISTVPTSLDYDVRCDGDSETGVVINIYVSGDLSNVNVIRIANNTTGETMSIINPFVEQITGSKITSGDTIIITTIQRNKKIELLTNERIFNILNAMDKNSDWIHLMPGNNVFNYILEGYDIDIVKDRSKLTFEIESKIRYEGV